MEREGGQPEHGEQAPGGARRQEEALPQQPPGWGAIMGCESGGRGGVELGEGFGAERVQARDRGLVALEKDFAGGFHIRVLRWRR